MSGNILHISKGRAAKLILSSVQADNRTKLNVVFESAADLDPTAAFRIDWERSNGSKAFLGTYLVDDSVEVIIPDVIFSHAGEIQCQVIVLVDSGELWHSTIARARLPRAIEAEIAATPDERRYVEVPASFVDGNLTTYNPDSGRLIDTGVSLAYLLTLYNQFNDWYLDPSVFKGPKGDTGKNAYQYAVEHGWALGELLFGIYLANVDKLMYDDLRDTWVKGVFVTQSQMEDMITNETTDPDTVYFVRLPEDL